MSMAAPWREPMHDAELDEVGPRESGQWEEVLSATHLPWSVRVSPELSSAAFRAVVRRQWIDDLALVDCECSPCSGVRGRSQIAATEGDYLVVLMNRGGSETVSQDGEEALLRPGDAVAWDSRRPARFAVWEPLVKRSLLIPRIALEGSGVDLAAGVVLERETAAMQLLGTYLDTLSKTLPQLSGGAITAARNATLELFRGALAPGAPTDPALTRVALRDAVDRFLDDRLASRELGVDEVAAAHQVSVRTVNRMFAETDETFSGVLRTKRLARVREELLAGDASVSALAQRWGFFDASHLARSFRGAYGMTPRQYRARSREHSEAPITVG
jgi:AraC family transcriptional activator of tynA and feaB